MLCRSRCSGLWVFSAISLFVLLHCYYLSRIVSWLEFLEFVSVAFLYTAASWALLYGLFGKNRGFRSRFFVSCPLTFLFWFTRSISPVDRKASCFFLLLLRPADQSSSTSRRVFMVYSYFNPCLRANAFFFSPTKMANTLSMSLELPKIAMVYLAGAVHFTRGPAHRRFSGSVFGNRLGWRETSSLIWSVRQNSCAMKN